MCDVVGPVWLRQADPPRSGMLGLRPAFYSLVGPVVQLVRMPPCHGGGRGFKSRPGRKGFGVVLFEAGVRTLFGLVAQLVRAND